MNIKIGVVFTFVAACLLAGTPASADSKLNVVASTEDLASIARELGGDRINIEAIARTSSSGSPTSPAV